MKTDAPPGRVRRSHELADGFEDGLNLLVVRSHTVFELGELVGQLLVSREDSSETDKGTYDKDAHLFGTRAVENISGHDRAMLGKGIRKVA